MGTDNWRQKVLEHLAHIIKERGGVPGCPKCGKDVKPHPLPQIVGLSWWTCDHGTGIQDDYADDEVEKPRNAWAPEYDFAREALALSKTLEE